MFIIIMIVDIATTQTTMMMIRAAVGFRVAPAVGSMYVVDNGETNE